MPRKIWQRPRVTKMSFFTKPERKRMVVKKKSLTDGRPRKTIIQIKKKKK